MADNTSAPRQWVRLPKKVVIKSESQLLSEAVKPLQLLNIDTSVFTPSSIISLFLFVKQYIRHTKIFLSLSDPQVMKDTALSAARAGVYDLSVDEPDGGLKLDPQDVLKISEWMKSGEGDRAMHVIYRKRKLEKKVRKFEEMMNYSDSNLLTQLEEYKSELKEINSHSHKKIDTKKI